jgi:hypothetical protein
LACFLSDAENCSKNFPSVIKAFMRLFKVIFFINSKAIIICSFVVYLQKILQN